MESYQPKFFAPNSLTLLIFEINSFLGRYFFKKRSRLKKIYDPFLIDIGVGSNFTDGWVHVDFFKNRIKKFWKRRAKVRKPEIETDLRFPLNCPSNYIDGVYSGHTLEHLYPNHAFNLLKEIYRILKPNCWIRINVPDLSYVIKYYNGEIHIDGFDFKAESISDLTQNSGHHSTWDFEMLSGVLKIIGFTNIKQVEFGKEGTDKRLIKEEEVRRIGTLVVEAQKPL